MESHSAVEIVFCCYKLSHTRLVRFFKKSLNFKHTIKNTMRTYFYKFSHMLKFWGKMCALYNRIECITQTALQKVVISQYVPLFLRPKMFCNSVPEILMNSSKCNTTHL